MHQKRREGTRPRAARAVARPLAAAPATTQQNLRQFISLENIGNVSPAVGAPRPPIEPPDYRALAHTACLTAHTHQDAPAGTSLAHRVLAQSSAGSQRQIRGGRAGRPPSRAAIAAHARDGGGSLKHLRSDHEYPHFQHSSRRQPPLFPRRVARQPATPSPPASSAGVLLMPLSPGWRDASGVSTPWARRRWCGHVRARGTDGTRQPPTKRRGTQRPGRMEVTACRRR